MLSLDWLHAMVSYLLPPALWALLLACAIWATALVHRFFT